METKYRFYKMHAGEDVDVSNLEKGLGKILQIENYLNPENAISEQIGSEVDSDNYGIVYSNKKVSEKKVRYGIFKMLSRIEKESEIEAVIMGNDEQLKIAKDYLISRGTTLSFSSDVKSAIFSFEIEDILGREIKRLHEYISKIDNEFNRKAEVQDEDMYIMNLVIKGDVKKIVNLHNNLTKGILGIKLDDWNLSFEF